MKHLRTLKIVLLFFELTKVKFCAISPKWNVHSLPTKFVAQDIHIFILPMLEAPVNSLPVLNERS
jgi:hypothetical protein